MVDFVFTKYSIVSRVLIFDFCDKCLNLELFIGNKACNFISLCRSPSQTQKHLENSLGNYKADLGLFSNQRPDLLVERVILLLGAQTGEDVFFRYLFRKHI